MLWAKTPRSPGCHSHGTVAIRRPSRPIRYWYGRDGVVHLLRTRGWLAELVSDSFRDQDAAWSDGDGAAAVRGSYRSVHHGYGRRGVVHVLRTRRRLAELV